MSFTTFTLHKTLQDIADSCWVSLHFDSPDQAGAVASEISGGGYSRERARFDEPSNNHMWLNRNLRWEGLPLTLVAYLGGWDQERNGNLQWFSEMSPPERILEGKGFIVPAQSLALSFS